MNDAQKNKEKQRTKRKTNNGGSYWSDVLARDKSDAISTLLPILPEDINVRLWFCRLTSNILIFYYVCACVCAWYTYIYIEREKETYRQGETDDRDEKDWWEIDESIDEHCLQRKGTRESKNDERERRGKR